MTFPNEFPFGVSIILGFGLTFTGFCIYYILKMAYDELNDG